MKIKFFLIFVCIWFGSKLTAQDIHRFIAGYKIQEISTSEMIPKYSDTLDYEIKIQPSSVDTFDIQFYLEAHFHDTIRAKVLNDSCFEITSQKFLNYDSTYLFITGNGKVFNDSIEIDYSAGGSVGSFQCICKGVKKKETGLNRVIDNHFGFQVFPNPVNETLYFDLKKESQDISIIINNMEGRLVLNKDLRNSNMIDVSELPYGIYLYIITDRKDKYSGLFIKE